MLPPCQESLPLKGRFQTRKEVFMKELWLRKGEDRRLIAGHLWIFANEVDVQKSPLGDFPQGDRRWAAPLSIRTR